MKQEDDTLRLLAIFLIGLSVGISLTLLYFDVIRKLF